MSNGPYLYDDDPAPLHTGTPRRRQGLMLAIFGGTALLAVLLVVALPLLKGSPEEQARETVGVFLAALAEDDTETAHQLLCAEERGRLDPADVAEAYVREAPGSVAGSRDAGEVQRVLVSWADGSTSSLSVIREKGTRICGTEPRGRS